LGGNLPFIRPGLNGEVVPLADPAIKLAAFKRLSAE
jgi:hypothetical protein